MRRRVVPDIVNSQHLMQVPPTTSVREAIKLMASRRVGAVLITDEKNHLLGIFTERDLLTRVVAQYVDPDTTTLATVMTPDPDTITPDETAFGALERMKSHGYRHLPVVDRGKLVGIVSIRDLYAFVAEELERDVEHHKAFIYGYYGADA